MLRLVTPQNHTAEKLKESVFRGNVGLRTGSREGVGEEWRGEKVSAGPPGHQGTPTRPVITNPVKRKGGSENPGRGSNQPGFENKKALIGLTVFGKRPNKILVLLASPEKLG